MKTRLDGCPPLSDGRAQSRRTGHRDPISVALSLRALVCCWTGIALSQAQAGEVNREAIEVSASGWESRAHGGVGDFPPTNTLDGQLSVASSWRAEGPGAWIQWDLGAAVRLQSIGLAFLFGDQRTYCFDLLVTADPEALRDWRPLKLKATSSGRTLGLERFETDALPVRHVRLVGYGNTSEKFPRWTNLTEVVFTTE